MCFSKVKSIFREAAFRVADYIEAQLEITDTMRSILVDWLVEVSSWRQVLCVVIGWCPALIL